MGENMSLSDIAAVTRGTDNDGWGSGWFLIVVLFLFMFGFGNNGWNRQGEFGQYATAASQPASRRSFSASSSARSTTA